MKKIIILLMIVFTQYAFAAGPVLFFGAGQNGSIIEPGSVEYVEKINIIDSTELSFINQKIYIDKIGIADNDLARFGINKFMEFQLETFYKVALDFKGWEDGIIPLYVGRPYISFENGINLGTKIGIVRSKNINLSFLPGAGAFIEFEIPINVIPILYINSLKANTDYKFILDFTWKNKREEKTSIFFTFYNGLQLQYSPYMTFEDGDDEGYWETDMSCVYMTLGGSIGIMGESIKTNRGKTKRTISGVEIFVSYALPLRSFSNASPELNRNFSIYDEYSLNIKTGHISFGLTINTGNRSYKDTAKIED